MKTHITISIETDVAAQIKATYPREVSRLVNQFFKSLLEYPEAGINLSLKAKREELLKLKEKQISAKSEATLTAVKVAELEAEIKEKEKNKGYIKWFTPDGKPPKGMEEYL